MENVKSHNCKFCERKYSSKSALSNHKVKVHGLDQISKKNKEDGCYHCKHCDKSYLIPQSRWAHQAPRTP